MAQTLSVLHTLRSSELTTASRTAPDSAASPTIIQAPPVPCRLTGVPAWAATAPSSATAAPGTAGDRQRQAWVVEQGMTARPGRLVDQLHRARRQTGGGQRRGERVLDDRPCGAECVRPDPEHDRVARPDDAARVGEHVGPTLEHEPDDTDRRPACLHRPSVVTDRRLDGAATAGLITPDPQAVDHVGTHPLAQFEAGRRPTGARGSLHVAGVRRGDRRERRVVGQALGEGLEEGRDQLVVARASSENATVAALIAPSTTRAIRAGMWTQRTRRLDDHETITGSERVGELGVRRRRPGCRRRRSAARESSA